MATMVTLALPIRSQLSLVLRHDRLRSRAQRTVAAKIGIEHHESIVLYPEIDLQYLMEQNIQPHGTSSVPVEQIHSSGNACEGTRVVWVKEHRSRADEPFGSRLAACERKVGGLFRDAADFHARRNQDSSMARFRV